MVEILVDEVPPLTLVEEEEEPTHSPNLSNTETSAESSAANSNRSSATPRSPQTPNSAEAKSKKAALIEKRHICDICGKGFPYLSILESHKRCHTGEKPFACHFCDKCFAQKATLQVHERTHTGERPYKCKYCEKTFAQYGTKTVHEKSAHLGIRNYKCPKCAKCLSSPSALYTHKKTHGEKVFQCPHCPKTFTLKNYLKLHVRQVHENTERRHICRFCQKSFSYAGSLQVHIRTHTGERPYVCKFCPKSFASQGNLQSHERTHTGERPYVCQHCGRSFIQKSQLTAHESTHLENSIADSPNEQIPTDSEAAGDFACKFCGKRYAYAASLYIHIRLHTGERPFQCSFCDKTFTNQGNMQVHQRVHTGERPFQCNACGKSYAQKVGLKIHHEQCQSFMNRRGSVATTSDSNSSSPLADEEFPIDVVADDSAFLSAPIKPQPLHAVDTQPLGLDSISRLATSLYGSPQSTPLDKAVALLSSTLPPTTPQLPSLLPDYKESLHNALNEQQQLLRTLIELTSASALPLAPSLQIPQNPLIPLDSVFQLSQLSTQMPSNIPTTASLVAALSDLVRQTAPPTLYM